MRTERSVTSDISSLLQNSAQFTAGFEEEANFCAGVTQIHTHSPTCVKYSVRGDGKRYAPCRFGAPWKLVDKTSLREDGVLQIQRSHNLVNRWNKAMAVGLRHNHDISFIATICKGLALVFYLTNYATKVEDPVWKRAAAAKEVLEILGGQTVPAQQSADSRSAEDGDKENKTRQLLMRVANRVFTDRALSQVEVIAYLLGYETEFTSSEAWTFLNVCSLYWHIFRRWRHLRHAAGRESADESAEETVLLEQVGQKITYIQAYPHRGSPLEDLCLYDYMAIVMIRRKGNGAGRRAVAFDSSWPFSNEWVQILRRPEKLASVCLDGYLGMTFDEEDESYHRRYVIRTMQLV